MIAIVVAPLVAIFSVALAAVGANSAGTRVQTLLRGPALDGFGVVLYSSFNMDTRNTRPSTIDAKLCPEITLKVSISSDGNGQIDWFRTQQQIRDCMRDQLEIIDMEPFASEHFRLSRNDVQSLFSEFEKLDWPSTARLASKETVISDYYNANCGLPSTPRPSDVAGITTDTTWTLYNVYRAAPRAVTASIYPDPSVNQIACSRSALRDEETIDAILASIPISYPPKVIQR